MKILLVAPEICPPWTEGRKRFVRDLSAAFSHQHDVRVLTTTTVGEQPSFPVPSDALPCRWRWQHLTSLHRELAKTLSSFQPNLVCHFPYGTFRPLYRMINLWSMGLIDRTCAAAQTRCLTVMYSISQEADPQQLRKHARHLVFNDSRNAAGDPVVHLGLDFAGWPEPAAKRNPTSPLRLLFMAGMWQRTINRLEHVLEIRGLEVLLRAGSQLAPQGMRLTVAAPLLADCDLQAQLRAHTSNHWPIDQLELTGEVKVPEIYLAHDLFVFPYGREEKQFTPTSVVEAMRAGTPVVLPELSFLHTLCQHAYTFVPGNVEHLANVISAAATDAVRYNTIRQAALDYVRKTYSIERACEDLLTVYQSLEH